MRKETIGNATLYLGDCMTILPGLTADAVVTDPPYGVGLGSRDNNNRHREAYEGFEDSPEYIKAVVVPAVQLALKIAPRGLVTCGVRNLHAYPIPNHIGSIYYPAATGCNVWGFSCWQPMLYYGNDPHAGYGSLHDSFTSTEQAEKNGHPCPKPLRQMIWMVNRVSRERGDTILDPFMGSGTTGIACQNLGRKFIGIELHEPYFNIACERIENAQRQERLFA
jgi:site-specific DNA-methyltransferase (adenine-specific)